MSLTVLAIGLAHGIPVVMAGLLTKNRIFIVLASLGMAYVGFALGGIQYVVIDLLGIAVGAFIAWRYSEAVQQSPSITLKQEINEAVKAAQNLDVRLNPFQQKVWAKLMNAGVGKGLDPHQLQNERKFVFRLAKSIFDNKEMTDELVMRANELASGSGKSLREVLVDIVRMAVAEGLAPEEAITRFEANFDAAFEAERSRSAAERMAELVKLAERS